MHITREAAFVDLPFRPRRVGRGLTDLVDRLDRLVRDVVLYLGAVKFVSTQTQRRKIGLCGGHVNLGISQARFGATTCAPRLDKCPPWESILPA